jgi:hypothetical protein
MPLYFGSRDMSLFRHLSKELVDAQISEEVAYYKFSLAETKVNIYGESKNKMYNNPVLLTCLYEVQDQMTTDDNPYGVDRGQNIDFKFLRYDLIQIGLVPEAGDIIMWQESYYEVDAIVENQRSGGKNPEYSLESNTSDFGDSWSIICKTHMTRVNKLNIVNPR